MKIEWQFDPCQCWNATREKAAEVGWPLKIDERYDIESTSAGVYPLAGRVTCRNCGSIREGVTRLVEAAE